MTDLIHLEALVGPLPQTTAWLKLSQTGMSRHFIYADSLQTVNELLAVIKRLAGMLDRIDRIVGDVPRTGDADSALMDIARVFSDAALAGRNEQGGGG